jgi:hypothetical protein
MSEPSIAPPLGLEEALRTLGLALEATDVRRVRLHVGGDGITAQAGGAYGTRTYGWSDLTVQSKILQEQRRSRQRSRQPVDPWALRRWSVLLRATGHLLDTRQLYVCEIQAQVAAAEPPQEASVGVFVAGRPVCDTAAVAEYLLRLRLQAAGAQDLGQGARKSASRPWWAWWRNA